MNTFEHFSPIILGLTPSHYDYPNVLTLLQLFPLLNKLHWQTSLLNAHVDHDV